MFRGFAALALLTLFAVQIPQSANAQQVVAVGIVNTPAGYRFAPGTLVVPVGTTVTWTVPKDDTMPHNVQNETRTGPFISPTLQAGDSWSFTFTEAGTYAYRCRFHGNQGQLGTVVVSNNAALQPASGVQAFLQALTAGLAPAPR
jgi:plastocyanin